MSEASVSETERIQVRGPKRHGKNTDNFTVRKDARTGSRTRLVSIQNRGLSEALADVPKYDKPNALFQLLSHCLQFLKFNNNIIIVSYSCHDKDASLW